MHSYLKVDHTHVRLCHYHYGLLSTLSVLGTQDFHLDSSPQSNSVKFGKPTIVSMLQLLYHCDMNCVPVIPKSNKKGFLISRSTNSSLYVNSVVISSSIGN